MDLALELCTLFRGGPASSVFEGEGAMTILFPAGSRHAVRLRRCGFTEGGASFLWHDSIDETEARCARIVRATESLIVGVQRFVGIRIW